MKQTFQIRMTMHRIARQLEHLAANHVALERAFDMLSKKALTVQEMVVVEVMREVYRETEAQRMASLDHADSSTRSARMPLMALSR